MSGGADAGIGDDDIDPAEFGDALVGKGSHGLQVPDSALPDDDVLALLLHQLLGLLEIVPPGGWVQDAVLLGGQVEREDVGAFLSHSDRMGATFGRWQYR